MAGPIKARDIWNMFPTTTWLVEHRPDHMDVDPAEFGQATQLALRLGQELPVASPPGQIPGQPQYLPVGQTTTWEVPDQPKDTELPGIQWWGVNDPNLPLFRGLHGGRFLGQVKLMGQFEAVPMSEEDMAAHPGYAMVNPLALAYSTGAFIRAGAPEWGRFLVMPAGVSYRV